MVCEDSVELNQSVPDMPCLLQVRWKVRAPTSMVMVVNIVVNGGMAWCQTMTVD